MPLPPELSRPESVLERIFESVLGKHTSLPRPQRVLVGCVGLLGYLALAKYYAGFAALALAIAFYGILQRWGIEEPEPDEVADAYVWAGVAGGIAVAAFATWWWFLGASWLQTWATHIWLPLGIVAIALAFDRRRRPLTATESLAQALSQAGARRRRPGPSDAPPEA